MFIFKKFKKGKLSKVEIRERAKMLLEKVGLGDRVLHYPN